jgi:hypothetical protein
MVNARNAHDDRRRLRVRVGAIAAAFVLFATVVAPSAAHAARRRRDAVDHALFERSPLGFSWETLENVRNRIAHVPQFISEMPQQISRQIQVLGPEDTLLRLLLVVTIILGLLARRRIFLWIETRLAPRWPRGFGEKARY